LFLEITIPVSTETHRQLSHLGGNVSGVWDFQRYQRGDFLRNPVTANFFAQEAIEDPAEALVRESIQNSLDARIAGQQVRVRFGLYDSGPADRNYRASLFAGLDPHLSCEDNGLEDSPDIGAPHRFVVVEDFGTKGLEGDPAQWMPDPEKKNDFFAFFRAEGHTDKAEEDRGRWGVGKTVFPRSSEANTFFAMTIRNSDGKALLMGRSILKGHRVDGKQFHPDGYYGAWRDGLAMPLEARADIDAFRRAFSLSRSDEPGLSVVVPLLQDVITFNSLLRAVLRDYFFAVLTGDLEVSIETERENIVLTSANLADVAREYIGVVGKDLTGLIELAVWSKDVPAERSFALSCPPKDSGAQTWDDFEIDDGLRTRLREAISTGSPIAVRVGVRVRRKHTPEQESWCDLFLWQRDASEQGRPLFIREGIIISNANGPRARGVLSIVSVNHKPLATFLGDAENVAHTEWSPDRTNFQQRYTYARATLRLVKQSVAELIKTVMAGREDRDPDLLRDFFSFRVPDVPPADGDEVESAEKKKKHRTADLPPVLPVSPPRYRVNAIEGGFTIKRGDPASPLPAGLIVKVAYDVRRGSALKAYDPADFLLDTADFSLEKQGLELKGIRGNRIDATVVGDDFRLTVKGFDPLRDIFVSVDAVDGDDTP
jgi:hypothetical protein